MKKLALACLMLGAVACGKDNDYVYKITPISSALHTESHALVGFGGEVDIIWVVDNSYSMDDIQMEIKNNTQLFMNDFVQNQGLKWRMAMLSTSLSEQPYLGLPRFFEYTDANPVKTFQDAVDRLGTSGDTTERTFDPILKAINGNSGFLRPNAFLIVIMVSDEPEQSTIKADAFVADLVARKTNGLQQIRMYGAFQATDLNCTATTSLTYAGSQYEKAITATGGKYYSACTGNFGTELSKLGREILTTVANATVLLRNRPLTETLRVFYKGEELPPGPRSAGGMWTYEADANAVRFHSIDFVDFNVRDVQVEYVQDSGQMSK